MKKNLLLITSTICLSLSAFAQQVNNNGFETWTSAGAYEDPESWTTLNFTSAFGDTAQVSKDTDAHSGSFSAKITTHNNAFLGVSGILLTNPAYTFRPESMEFYYKYASVATDMGLASVTLTKWDAINLVQIEVGSGVLQVSSASAYTLGTVDITYSTADVPDSMSILFSATDLAAPAYGSVMNVDDINFVMPSSASIAKVPFEVLNSVYPNPAKDNLYIKSKDNKATSIEITDLSGRTVDVISVKGISVINIVHLNDGNYLYNLKDGNVILSRGKFSVVK